MNAVLDNTQNENENVEVFIPAAQNQSLTHINKMLPAMSLDEANERYQMFVGFVKNQLKSDIDYGVIPGTGDKKVLLKPGAEKLCTFFGLRPILKLVEKEEDWQGYAHEGEPFFYYKYACELWRGDVLITSSEASCNSWEKKYRYRQGQLKCPECGQATVFKSKPPAVGWYCWAKKNGCGAQFGGNDERIKNQDVGRVANAEIFDQVNTLQKMAQKRALVGSTIYAVNASEFFTQDLEDLAGWLPPDATQENELIGFPRDPVAKTIQDLVTAPQLGMIRALARDLGINYEEECQAVLGCKTDELSKKAASSFIEHLKKLGEEIALNNMRRDKPQSTTPSQEKNITPPATRPETNDKTSADTRNKRGAGIAAMGNVIRKDNGYQVLTPSLRGRQVSYEVWRDGKAKIRCSCLEFEENVAIDDTYKCEHIYAVSHFVAAEKQAASQQQQPDASNPATERIKLLLELSEKANVNLEDECQNILAVHPDELTEEQATTMMEHLQTIILEQEKVSAKVDTPKQDEWKCTPATRQRIEKLANDIAAHPLGMTKAELLKLFRKQTNKKDAPQCLSEAEAAGAADGLQKYLDDLNADLKKQQELDAKQGNQGNNRGNAK